MSKHIIKIEEQKFIITNGSYIEQVRIIRFSGNLVTIGFQHGAIRVPKHRLYNTKEEAESQLLKNKESMDKIINDRKSVQESGKRIKIPWDYDH